MAAPVVEDLTTLMAKLDPAYAQSRDLYNQQLSTIPQEQAATMQGIETDKNNAFSGIAKGANSKGLDFWGIPLEEQSKYLGGTYLTSKNNAIAASANKQMTLQQALAQLEQDRYKTALSTQQGEQSAANAYQTEQEKMAFQANQAALDRAAAASNSAAKAASTPLTQTQTVAAIRSGLEQVKGKDNHVAPQDLARAYQDWLGSGYDAASFWKNFQGYWNPKQGDYGKQFYGS